MIQVYSELEIEDIICSFSLTFTVRASDGLIDMQLDIIDMQRDVELWDTFASAGSDTSCDEIFISTSCPKCGKNVAHVWDCLPL